MNTLVKWQVYGRYSIIQESHIHIHVAYRKVRFPVNDSYNHEESILNVSNPQLFGMPEPKRPLVHVLTLRLFWQHCQLFIRNDDAFP